MRKNLLGIISVLALAVILFVGYNIGGNDPSSGRIRLATGGEGGRLYGSVTSQQIAEKLREITKVAVDKRKINLETDIKSFGSFNAKIKLHPKVSAKIIVRVVE